MRLAYKVYLNHHRENIPLIFISTILFCGVYLYILHHHYYLFDHIVYGDGFLSKYLYSILPGKNILVSSNSPWTHRLNFSHGFLDSYFHPLCNQDDIYFPEFSSEDLTDFQKLLNLPRDQVLELFKVFIQNSGQPQKSIFYRYFGSDIESLPKPKILNYHNQVLRFTDSSIICGKKLIFADTGDLYELNQFFQGLDQSLQTWIDKKVLFATGKFDSLVYHDGFGQIFNYLPSPRPNIFCLSPFILPATPNWIRNYLFLADNFDLLL